MMAMARESVFSSLFPLPELNTRFPREDGDDGGNEELELDPTTKSILSSLEHSPFEKRLIRYR